MKLPDLRMRHAGETAWVFGSGASLNFVDPRFFDDKLVISTNGAAFHFGAKPRYAFTHHHRIFHALAADHPDTIFVANRFDYPTRDEWPAPAPENVVIHEPATIENSQVHFTPYGADRPGPDQLVFGSSSVHGSMHLAAYLGCAAIVLVGVDCGALDGEVNFRKYPHATQRSFRVWSEHLVLMKRWLAETYGVSVYSLNPFVSFQLEGHTYSPE